MYSPWGVVSLNFLLQIAQAAGNGTGTYQDFRQDPNSRITPRSWKQQGSRIRTGIRICPWDTSETLMDPVSGDPLRAHFVETRYNKVSANGRVDSGRCTYNIETMRSWFKAWNREFTDPLSRLPLPFPEVRTNPTATFHRRCARTPAGRFKEIFLSENAVAGNGGALQISYGGAHSFCNPPL